MQAAKKTGKLVAGDSGIGRCCPSANLAAGCSFHACQIDVASSHEFPSSTIQAVKCVILYLLMEDRPQPNTVYIRLPTFVTIPKCHANPFPDSQVMRGGYHAVVDSRYAKMMSDMSVLHNSGIRQPSERCQIVFFNYYPTVFMPEYQTRDFVTTATPFRGCDRADPALSADIAWPRDVSESLKSSGF